MDNILVLEGSSDQIRSIESEFEKYNSKINLLIAADSAEAINFLKTTPVSVLVADLLMLDIDDLALLTYVSRHHPTTPCIVMAAFSNPEEKELFGNLGIYHFLAKPFEPEYLMKIIAGAIKKIRNGEAIRSLSTIGFLQLLQEKQSNCILKTTSQADETGRFYLVDGKLQDAMRGNLQGEEAAIDILGWEKVSFSLHDLPTKGLKARINLGLKDLSAKVAAVPKKENKGEKRTEVPKKNLSGMLSQAIRSAEFGNTKLAQQVLAKILKINPKSSVAWLWFARTAADFKTINVSLTKADTITPNNPEIGEEIKKLKSAINSGCREDSILKHCFFCWAPIVNEHITCHYCKARVSIHEEFAQSIFFGSEDEPDLKLIEESFQRFTKASNSDPKNGYGHFLLAMAHINLNHWKAAVEELNQANSLDPGNQTYREKLAILADFVDDMGDFAGD
ncbi:MAG: response regulator [Thermodesulfobacteriota bacterium]